MALPFDIVHYIFSFLKSSPRSLIACSNAHPSFSPIAERYLYYRIVIHTSSESDYRTSRHGYHLEPSPLLKLLSESPQIANYVRVLQLTFSERRSDQDMDEYEKIAQILQLFPSIECLILQSIYSISWQKGLPQTLRMAVENCLCLPTMQEIHIGAALIFPLTLLNKHANITLLSFSAQPQTLDRPDDTYPPLQLKSLILGCLRDNSISTWAKPLITTLRSLQCEYSNEKMILEFLDICSGTLNNLDLAVRSPYGTWYYFNSGRVLDANKPPEQLIDLSSLRYLQHLTIRVLTYSDYDRDLVDEDSPEYPQEFCISCLPAAAKILKTAASSLQHLTIEILINDYSVWNKFDFSPLTILAEASAPFHHIDLYITAPFSKIYRKLALYEGLKKLIKQGILIIHAEQTAPGISRFE